MSFEALFLFHPGSVVPGVLESRPLSVASCLVKDLGWLCT